MKEAASAAEGALPDRGGLLEFIASARYHPMTARGLAAAFNVPPEHRSKLRERLREMELDGEVVLVKRGRYATPRRVNLIVGRLQCKPRGFGFIVPLRRGAFEDAYVSAEDMGEALHDDIVAARLVRPRGRRAAQVVRVVKRARSVLVGTYEQREGVGYVAPDHPGYFKDLTVARQDRGGAEAGDKVAVKITAWPSRHLPPQGRVLEVLGRQGEPGVDVRSVIIEFGLPHVFGKEVKQETERVPGRVRPSETKGRLDLRDETVFTVDPEEARDFDDAVSIKRRRNGDWLLGVHIADVSHYVKPGSAVDEEATERATSVYLPGHVIPMLPEKLSNGICSLVEGRTRLTRSVLMTFGPRGKLKRYRVRRSVIRSAKRLTYRQLLELLEGGSPPKGIPRGVSRSARMMGELAGRLREQRLRKGMLELDMPEARLDVDSNGDIARLDIERGDAAHRLIEDFMLAANEAVADYIYRRKLPPLARVHPSPDPSATHKFTRMARGLGFSVPDQPTRRQLQPVLRAAHEQTGGYALMLLLLRSLQMAEYRAEWDEHYGLAMKRYTHFTSPIRRLPDLLVHRLLDIRPHGDEAPEWTDRLPELAEHSSIAERRAEEAERELVKIKIISHLKKRRDEVFDAVVIGIEDYGMWVELADFMIDGLVRVSSLTDGFYTVDRTGTRLQARGGRRFVLGQSIRVCIDSIDELKRQINLQVVR